VSDDEFASCPNSIAVYSRRLRRKSDAPAPVKLLHAIRGSGYRFGAAENGRG